MHVLMHTALTPAHLCPLSGSAALVRRRRPPLLPSPPPRAAAAAAFAASMSKLYNNLGLRMMERRKHEEALGLVNGAGAAGAAVGAVGGWG